MTATSENRHPTLPPHFYDGALEGGRHWYYAEYFTNQQLLDAFTFREPHGIELFKLITATGPLGGPRVVVYHFFYALHEEPLSGCEKAGEGQLFLTFAGEWSSVAIIIDSRNRPVFIGLTSRNVGDPTSLLPDGGIPFEDNRIGMSVYPWEKVDAVGEHPKIFVSRGTHGNYLEPGPKLHPLQPFTPGDVDLNQKTCGEIELLDDVVPEDVEVTLEKEGPTVWAILGAGFLITHIGSILFRKALSTYSVHYAPETDPNRAPQDETGGPNFGLILRPADLSLSETSFAQTTEAWPTKMPDPADKPRYGFIVDRETQLWWTPRGPSLGYPGRWGPRVTNDPKQRRSGMRCPPSPCCSLRVSPGSSRPRKSCVPGACARDDRNVPRAFRTSARPRRPCPSVSCPSLRRSTSDRTHR